MAASFEKQGSVTNTGRWAQWRWKAVEPLGDCIDDAELFTRIFVGVKNHYLREPGKLPDPITKMQWPYVDEHGHADSRRVARAINGYDIETGRYLSTFGDLKADGSTACGCWIYTGYYANNDTLEAAYQQSGSRNFKDYGIDGMAGGVGLYVDWSFAWPANRRILYNRASADMQGRPYNPNAPLVAWNGERWLRNDVPDFAFTNADGSHKQPDDTMAFMMTTENVALLFSNTVNDGPFPEHYEPYESPTQNVLSAKQTNPAALVFEESSNFGTSDEYPIVCTTYRLSEHWQAGAMTRNKPWTAECQPHMFVEMSEELAERLHLVNGDLIEVYNNRGSITTNLMVTKRFKPLMINGKEVDTVGMPWHYGFAAMSSKGATANQLTPSVGDANSYIPEYKAFLVNIRKAGR